MKIQDDHVLTRDEVALFRYSIIAPLVTRPKNDDHSKEWHFRNLAKQIYINKYGKEFRYSAVTIKRWYLAYMLGGLKAITPGERSDKGGTRKLSPEAIEYINQMLNNHQRVKATTLYEGMIEKSIINKNDFSLATVTRYVSNYRKLLNIKVPEIDMRRYEVEHVNEVWCGDTTYGPMVKFNGELKRVYIIAFIDDKSRYIVGVGASISDNTFALADVMKNAIQRHGIPRKFNFDNGSNYKSDAIQTIVARIKSEIHYNRPYTPTGKAKIERWFRTLKDQWISTLNPMTYEEFVDGLREFVIKYNKTPHSSLDGKSPWDVYFEDNAFHNRLADFELDEAFTITITRKASIDRVIVVGNVQYEVPAAYAGQNVNVHVSTDLSKVCLVSRLGERYILNPLDKVANSKSKRTYGNNFNY